MTRIISKSLIIGVGGTGQNIVTALKKRLFQRFGELPDLIKMVSIDADAINERDDNFSFEFEGIIRKQPIGIDASEKFHFGRVNMKNQLEDGIYKKFVPDNIKGIAARLSSGKGAEGKRIVGRMLMASNFEPLERFLTGKIEQIISKTSQQYNVNSDTAVRVFIVGSFAGGAGSSMFVDISSILKASKYADNVDLVGFFAMPEFYSQYPNQDNALANAYGCFLELDHIQEPDPETSRIPDFNGDVVDETRFSSVYVVQNILSNTTKIDRDTMEDAVAASISNLVSVMGEKGDEIGVNNLQFDDYTMKGKRRGYSSFGICEIVLKREELKQYIVNRLILNSLNEYKINNFSKDEFDKRCNEFIEVHNLDEGVGIEAKKVNKLIDSIYELKSAELNVVFNEVTVSDSVISDLKESYKTFRQELDRKTDSVLIAYDDNILHDVSGKGGEKAKGIMSELKETMQRLLYSNGGLSRTKLFAESFVSQITKMRQELNIEISEHEEEIEKIENAKLTSIYAEIEEKQKGFFSKKKHIKELIEHYKFVISSAHDSDSFRGHYLEIIRKRKAIDVYKKLSAVVREYYAKDGNESHGRVAIFEENVNMAVNAIGMDIRQFKTANEGPIDKININLNSLLIKVLDTADVYQDVVKNNPLDVAKYLAGNSNTNHIIDDLKQILADEMNNGETILAKLSDPMFSIDKLIATYENVMISIGSENTGRYDISLKDYLIRTMNNNLPIMWKYERMNVPHDGGKVKLPELVAIIGNFDGEEGFVDYDVISKFEGLPAKISANAYSKVATNNPNVISIYIQEHAIPAYKLDNMRAYKRDYVDLSKSHTSYYHTDVRFESYAPDIFPRKNDELTAKAWVIGFITGVIFNKGGKYYVKSKSGLKGMDVRCFDESSSRGKTDRALSFEYFAEHETFSKEIEESYEKMLHRDKQRVREQLLEYLHDGVYSRRNLGKFKTSLNDKEEELLFEEQKMVIRIGLDDLGMHSRDFIDGRLSGAELEKHLQYLEVLGAEEVR